MQTTVYVGGHSVLAVLWRKFRLTVWDGHWRETWVHHWNPESKRQGMELKHPGFPWKQKFRGVPSVEKKCQPSGILKNQFWNIIKKKDKLLTVQLTQLCCKANRNLQFTTEEENLALACRQKTLNIMIWRCTVKQTSVTTIWHLSVPKQYCHFLTIEVWGRDSPSCKTTPKLIMWVLFMLVVL